jgi:biopolymer transport protein TolQ
MIPPAIILLLQAGSVWQIIQGLSAFGAFILSILVIMSLISWMVIFRKIRQFRASSHDTDSFLKSFRRSHQLAEIAGQAETYGTSPLSGIFKSGFKELQSISEMRNEVGGLRAQKEPLRESDYELVEMAMERSATEEMGKLEKQVVFLATTASSAPFMGLLGTVVGIMDSFWSIGERGSASLAIVAPGIAEALLATIVGLGAAIPAVMAYNWANNRSKTTYDTAMNFVLEFMGRVRKEAI